MNAKADITRRLLAPDYSVSRIINGGWQLSEGHRDFPPDRDETVNGMLRLVGAGFSTFDCGDIYVGVEELLGRVVAAHRTSADLGTSIQVHTKFVPDLDVISRIQKKDVERVIDRSLHRLGVERLDLVQLHWWDYGIPGYVETATWLDELRQAGKIRLVGATNFDVGHLKEIVDAGVVVASHQVQYSLLDRRAANSMVRFSRERRIPLLAYGTLAGGFLSDRYLGLAEPQAPLPNRSLIKYRLIIDEFGGWDTFQELLVKLDRIARRHQVSISNVAAAWALQQPQVAAIVVGAVGDQHLEDNVRVFGLALDDADHALLESFEGLGPHGSVYGIERDRTGPHGAIMKYNLNRNSS